MKPRILVTGFRPFLHHTTNASEQVLSRLKKERSDIDTLLLPVSFKNSYLEFQKHWDAKGPYESVVMLGQANGRALVSLERVALNWMESKSPDNDGECPPGGRIIADAPDSYLVDFFPSSWKEALSQAVGGTGSAKLAEVSLTAGAYVCNNLYYKVTHELRDTGVKALFVHLPLLPEQICENAGSPSMELQTQMQVVHQLIQLIAGTRI